MNIIASLCLLVICATSCASYKAQTLPRLSQESAPYSETKESIVVSCKAFTKQDCMRYLDRDVIAKGFQPVQISIENNSKRYLSLSKNGISVPCADAGYVADQVHTSTVGRSTAYGVAGLFIWPLLIPAVVDGIKSSNANEQLDRDFASKSSIECSIEPYSRFTGVIFVPVESYNTTITITLVDKETKEGIPFTLQAVRS